MGTAKAVVLHGIDILRVTEGRITELWHIEDVLSLYQQLGIVPA